MKIVEVITREYYYEKEDGTRTLTPLVVKANEKKLPIKYDTDGFDRDGYNVCG